MYLANYFFWILCLADAILMPLLPQYLEFNYIEHLWETRNRWKLHDRYNSISLYDHCHCLFLSTSTHTHTHTHTGEFYWLLKASPPVAIILILTSPPSLLLSSYLEKVQITLYVWKRNFLSSEPLISATRFWVSGKD